MKISFFGNDREYAQHAELIHKVSSEVWKTGQYLNGAVVEEFEKSLAKFCQRDYALSLGSCTDALTYSLQYLNLQKDDEVLVTNFSFLSSATSILRAGCNPVFCDIDPKTMMVTRESLEKNKSEKTKAVLVVSLFGNLAPMDEVVDFCQQNNLTLIEDAAQSFGATYFNKKAGSFGIASAVSFDPTKLLHGTGAGGALLTNNEELYQFAKTLRLHGRDENGNFIRLGNKSLLPTHDAALMKEKLSLIDSWIIRRQKIARQYQEAFKNINYAVPQIIEERVSPTFHKFVILCESHELREKLKDHFNEKGITTRVHYGKTISHESLFSNWDAYTPQAESVCEKVLSLPLYHELTDEEVEYICQAIKAF